MNLYNFEVIDEDAFIQWKEELNDVHSGKGQALFQVVHLIGEFLGHIVRIFFKPSGGKITHF